jgi:thiamine biosynthesis lipoprotein
MPSATAADALSTAFSLMPVAAITQALRHLGEGQVRLTTETGEAIALQP